MSESEEIEHKHTRDTYRRMAYDAGQDIDRSISINHELLSEFSHQDYILELLKIEDLVNTITTSTLPAFSVEKVKNGKPILTYHPLAKYFTSITELFELVSSEYEYSPNVELFFTCCFKLELGKEFLRAPLAYGFRPIRQFEIYNELIELIRTESRTQRFRSKVAAIKSKASYRLESSRQLINKVFDNYAKVVVLRIDFSYKYPEAENVTDEQARADLKRFLNNRRHNKALFENCITYIWKLEWGPEKGYHYHLIFFYNGRDVRNDAYWSYQICEYWGKITGGIGKSFDCNRDKDRYARLGIGAISRKDDAKRKILVEDVVDYLTKTDQCLRVKRMDRDRCYGTGAVAKKSNAGRPRTDEE